MRRALAALGLLVLAAALVYAGSRLWHTSVPGSLHLPSLDVRSEVAAAPLRRAESFEAFLRVMLLLSQVVLVVVLALYARRGAAYATRSAAGPIGTGFLLGMLGLGLTWLAGLPFAAVGLWWARRHHVVHTGYLSSLLGDWASLGARFVLLCGALAIAMGLARLLRRAWWVPVAVVFTAVTLLFAFVTPWLIADLHAPHSTRVRSEAAVLARTEGVPGVAVRIERVHKVTSTPNAYSAGLGPSRRVVLWDTIARFPYREVRFTLGHELAHQARHHILKDVAWYLLLALPIGLLVAVLTRGRGGLARPEAIPLALLIVVVAQLVTSPLMAAKSRRYEAEADWSSLNVTRDPGAMIGLFRHFTSVGLADPDPPSWYQTLFADHPSGLERIAMARAWAAREGVPVR
ncbi:MAG: endopeptidase [Thermoleophilaceae bacterium]|nr:endopeptidase [Thermoleophilaceae bacterium]